MVEQTHTEQTKANGAPQASVKKNFKKLATHEDPYHLHKTLGILSLLHFFYRYFWVLPTTGNLGFEGSKFDWVSMTTHLLLSSSSLIFHVVKSRMLKFPMIMWNEYRLHAIVFTLRCWSVFAMGYFTDPRVSPALANFAQTIPGRLTFFAIVLGHHVLADMITEWFGTPGVTAVRVVKSKRTGKIAFASVKLFYSFYQFLAVASHVFVNTSSPEKRNFTMDLGFNTLIAIQSSAFLMTLCRKNIITFKTHGAVYSFCLLMSSAYMVRALLHHGIYQAAFIFAVTSAVFAMRIKFRINKYLLWASFTLATAPQIGLSWAISFAYAQALQHSSLLKAVHDSLQATASVVVRQMFFTYTQLGVLLLTFGVAGVVRNRWAETSSEKSSQKSFASKLVQGLSDKVNVMNMRARMAMGIHKKDGSMFELVKGGS